MDERKLQFDFLPEEGEKRLLTLGDDTVSILDSIPAGFSLKFTSLLCNISVPQKYVPLDFSFAIAMNNLVTISFCINVVR